MFSIIILQIVLAALLILLIGDFLSTFFYHVPEHVFGKFHTIVHHGKNRSFIHYAVLSKNPLVLLDGFLGALPYFLVIPFGWQISPIGTILGMILGELHVIWRHVSIIKWKTPRAIAFCCQLLFITTPERHWQHHLNANLAYGDIFTFDHRPAMVWMRFLQKIKQKINKRYQKTIDISKA